MPDDDLCPFLVDVGMIEEAEHELLPQEPADRDVEALLRHPGDPELVVLFAEAIATEHPAHDHHAQRLHL